MNPDPIRMIARYYASGSSLFHTLINHSQAVADKSIEIATRLGLDNQTLTFINEAAILHDIGIYLTQAPGIGCTGSYPYICHGFLGHNILVREGWPKHALVCERHTGTGLTLSETRRYEGLLPARPMVPVSLEEQIISYSDKFFSKEPGRDNKERTVDEIIRDLQRFGQHKAVVFINWHKQFSL
jgi:uncharacterized protein